MDNKRNIIALVVVVAVSMVWLQVIYPWMARKNNWAIGPTTQPTPALIAPTTSTTIPTGATSGPATNPIAIAGLHASSVATSTDSVMIGSTAYDHDAKGTYPLGVTISPRGASVTAVTLNRYKAEYNQDQPYVFQKSYPIASPLSDSMATRFVTVDGSAPVPLDSLDWKVMPSTTAPTNATAASLSAQVMNGSDVVVRITKVFELKPTTDKTAGYEITVRYELENLTDQPHVVRVGFNGPTAPKPENSRDTAEVMGGFDGGATNIVVEHKGITSIKLDQPLDLRTLKSARMLWSGMTSSYFDTIVRPTDAAGAPMPLASATATLLEKNDKEPPVAIAYETGDLTVPAHSSTSFTLNTYFGPKLRSVLETRYYEAFPLSYEETLVLSSGCYSICTSSKLINLLVYVLNFFHFLLRDWGLAIIGLVLLVRLILHPITKSSQVSMSRMTKMGPEMERLKAKYGDDTEGLKKAQVEFYQEQGIAPFLGCLPMFLQMPIWVALWSALQSTFEIRHAPFLQFGGHSFTWIHDLSQPDHLIAFKEPISFFFLHIDGLNLLPILMGVVFYINQKLQPQPMAMKPEQAQQQKMMQWMSFIMFPLFLYSSPSGLNLYIFTSTLIGIFESKRIRAHIKAKEEREKAGVVIIDGPAGKKTVKPGVNRAIGGGLAGFFGKLQQLAEDAKKEQERQGKKNR